MQPSESAELTEQQKRDIRAMYAFQTPDSESTESVDIEMTITIADLKASQKSQKQQEMQQTYYDQGHFNEHEHHDQQHHEDHIIIPIVNDSHSDHHSNTNAAPSKTATNTINHSDLQEIAKKLRTKN